jgi:hypothetical protein
VRKTHSSRKVVYVTSHTKLENAEGMSRVPPPALTIEPHLAVKIFKDLEGHELIKLDHLAELCPWLVSVPMSPPMDRFDDLQDSWHHEMRHSGPLLCAQLWKEPLEGTFFADLLLISPPCYSVFIHLEYKQEDGTNLCADRRICEKSALTIGSVLQAARKMRGRVSGEKLVDSAGHRRQCQVCQSENMSLDAELASRRLRGEHFKMDCWATYIRFDNKGVVTAKVWRELQRKQMMSDADDAEP